MEEYEFCVVLNIVLLYVWILIEDKGINICIIKVLNKVKLMSMIFCIVLIKMMNSRFVMDFKSIKNFLSS